MDKEAMIQNIKDMIESLPPDEQEVLCDAFFSLQFILLHLLQGFTNFCLRWYSINKIAKIMIMIVTVVCMC